jgi:hypothetical protein
MSSSGTTCCAVAVWQDTSRAIRQLSKTFDRLEAGNVAAADLVRRTSGTHLDPGILLGKWLIWTA